MNNSYVRGGTKAWIIWSVSCLVVVFGFNLQTGYSLVNGKMSQELGIDIEDIALAGSIYSWVFAVSQLFSGSILDYFGIRKVFPISVFMILLGAITFALAKSYEHLIVAQCLLAMGASFGFVGAGFTGAIWFNPLKFGLMFGLVQTIASLGSFAGQIIFSYFLGEGETWRVLLYGMCILGVITLLLVLLFIRDPEQDGKSIFRDKKLTEGFFTTIVHSLTTVLKKKNIWLSSINGGITFGAFLAIAVIWGTKIMRAKGFTLEDAGYISSMIWLGLAVFSPIADIVSRKLQSRKQALALFAIVQTAGALGIIYDNSSPISIQILYMLIYGAGAAGHMVAFTIGADVVKPNYIGSASAIINGAMFIICGFMIGLPGRILGDDIDGILTLADYQYAMQIIPIALGVAFVSSFILTESFPKHKEVSNSFD